MQIYMSTRMHMRTLLFFLSNKFEILLETDAKVNTENAHV